MIALIDATFTVAKRKPEKNSGLYGIRTLDLRDTGAALLTSFNNWANKLSGIPYKPEEG